MLGQTRAGLVQEIHPLVGVLERDEDVVVDNLAELVVLAVDPLLALARGEDVGGVGEDEDEVDRVWGFGGVDGEDLLDRVELEVELGFSF